MRKIRILGMTLLEILIAMGVLGFVLAVMYEALIPAIRGLKRNSADTETQQSAVVAMEKIREGVRLTTPYSITVYKSTLNPRQTAIGFLSARHPLVSGTIVDSSLYSDTKVVSEGIYWEKFDIIYLDPDKSMLKLKEIPIGSTNEVIRLKSEGMRQYIENGSLHEQTVAQNIYSIDFYSPRFPCILVDVMSNKFHMGLDMTGKRKESKSRVVQEIMPQN